MALTIKVLGFGTLTGTTLTALTSITQATKALVVKNIIFTNGPTSTVNLDITVRQGSTDNYIVRAQPIVGNGQFVFDKELTLNLNNANVESVFAKLSASGGIDYVVNGLERDV